MAVNMTFFANFSKRENSTKQPSGGTVYSVTFKDTFSPYTGGVVLLNASYSTLKTYTEVLYDSMYYTIEDIKIVSNNHCEMELKLDLLATYKSNIASLTCLIARSPSNVNQAIYNDNLVSPCLPYNIDYWDISYFNHITTITGFCFQVVTENSKSVLAYYLNSTALEELLQDSSSFWNYSQYIKSIIACPFATSYSGGTATDKVYLGDGNYVTISSAGSSCSYINAQSVRNMWKEKLNISLITNSLHYTDFRKYDNNYVQVTFEMCGITIPIDSRFLNNDYIKYEVKMDNFSLDAEVSLYVGYVEDGYDTDYLIHRSNVNIGLPTNFAATSSSIDRLNAVMSATNSIAGAKVDLISGKSLPGAPSEIASAISNYHNIVANANQIGSTGGSVLTWKNLYDNIKVNVITFSSTPKYPLDFGYPYFEITNINTVGLNGFYKLMTSEIDLAAPEFIKLDILNKITNGFFYE